MCDIAGFVYADPDRKATPSCYVRPLRAMCDPMVHREPDEDGEYIEGPERHRAAVLRLGMNICMQADREVRLRALVCCLEWERQYLRSQPMSIAAG